MPPRLALATAVLLGAVLRFFPVWFGLPYSHARPDETTALAHALSILAGDPNPHFFNWPSLALYLFAGLFHVAAAVKGTLDSADYFVIARCASAFAGTATILVLWRLARRVTDDRVATFAAAFLAVAILHVRDSHFATTDVLMTLFVIACLSLVADGIASGSLRSIALAGVAGGLATSTKYSAAPLLLTVVAGWPGKGARWRHTGLFLLAFAAGFVIGTPYAVADFPTFRHDLLFERSHLAAGHTATDQGVGWLYHLTRSLPYGLGIPMYAAALAGIVPLLTRYRRSSLPLVIFAATFFTAIGSGRTVFFRYILPLMPLACLSAAVFVVSTTEWAARRFRSRARLVEALLIAVVAIPSLVNSVWMDVLLARTDSRVLAAEWLIGRLRPEDTMFDAGGDYTRLELGRTAFHEWQYDSVGASFVNAGGRTPDWIVLYDSPLRDYATTDPRLRALAASRYAVAYQVTATGASRESIFDPQDAFFLPIAGFGAVLRPGPDVTIYRLRSAEPR